MMPKAPKWQDGLEAIKKYREALDLYETTIRARTFREFYRKDLSSLAKRYRALADRRPEGSEARAFYFKLSALFEQQLANYGPEPPPKRRPSKAFEGVPLAYPDIPDELTLRVHFPATGSTKREKAAAMARYADHISRQSAPSGDVLLSAAVGPEGARFFEHLIEATGVEDLFPPQRPGAFVGWDRPEGSRSDKPDWYDERSPWVRIRNDNDRAMLYHWSPRRIEPPPNMTYPDVTWILDSLPWDPDPRFREVLAATQKDELGRALVLAEAIPATDRELQFDEMIYLRFLTGSTPRGGDLRYLAKKYVARSTLKSRLEAELHDFIRRLDVELAEAGPITDDFPGFADRSWLYERDSTAFVRSTPPLSDWQATRQHYREAIDLYGHPIAARGRFFIWHPNIAASSSAALQSVFAPQMIGAENSFRRDRGIPEIGRGWVNEVALYGLVLSMFPDAIHQWRPAFLGQQSVDIYVATLGLAIEYQGQQHYEAIDLFGGEEGLAATKARDKRKRDILAINGVGLVEWHYSTPITEENVRKTLSLPRIQTVSRHKPAPTI